MPSRKTRAEPAAEPARPIDERLDHLRELIPEAFSEGKIDWERLRAALGDAVDERPERYQFTWAGKRDAIRMLQSPSRATLVADRNESVNFDTTENIFIEGENLEVLKLLYKPYFGRIKMIYIDPPYNTANDFIYPDDFSEPLDNYLRRSGQKDSEGNLLTSNPESTGRLHSRWLSMMYPRLWLARQLLSEDGAIFVSCNDIEQAPLKLVLAEIFGEENFVATFVWNNEGNIDNQSRIKTNHEYIHLYARNESRFARPSVIDPNIEDDSKLYRDKIENAITKNGPANPPSRVILPAGFPAAFEDGVIPAQTEKYPYVYSDAEVKNGLLVSPVVVESGWSSRNLLMLFIKNGFEPISDAEGKVTWFALTATGAIYGYKARSETQGHVLSVIRNVGTTKQNGSLLRRWGLDFPWPKPELLIRYFCRIAAGPHDYVLDFFSGSATTAHSVFSAVREDGVARRFILVQLPEATGVEQFPTISAMGRERIRRVIRELHDENAVAQRSFMEPVAEDLGFRAFRLAESHLRPWREDAVEGADAEQYLAQLDMMADPLVEGADPVEVIREVSLREGYSLTSRIEREAGVAEIEVYRVTDPDREQSFHITLAEQVRLEALRPLGLGRDDLFVCRDAALDDATAANLALQCRLKTL